jgi:membrane protease YdiL (CAAX protease family)
VKAAVGFSVTGIILPLHAVRLHPAPSGPRIDRTNDDLGDLLGQAGTVEPGRPHLLLRLGAVFAAACLIWIAVYTALAPLGEVHTNRLGHAARALVTVALTVPMVVLARRYLDRRPWRGMGLTCPRWALVGGACWLAAAALGTTLTLGLGWATVAAGTWPTPTLLLAIYLPVLVFLFEALPEELVFRGHLYRNLADRFPRWLAVLGQAVLFTAFGVLIGAAGSVDRIVLFFTFSLTLGALRAVTGSLWAPIGFHLAFQYVTQLAAAATRDGALLVEGFPDLQFVAFWLLPIVGGGLVLAVLGARRSRWREREPDPVATHVPAHS